MKKAHEQVEGHETGKTDQNIITNKMLHAAVKEAVRLGVIPKYVDEDSYLKNWGHIKSILNAALEAAQSTTTKTECFGEGGVMSKKDRDHCKKTKELAIELAIQFYKQVTDGNGYTHSQDEIDLLMEMGYIKKRRFSDHYYIADKLWDIL